MSHSLFLDNCTLIDACDRKARPGMAISIDNGEIQVVALTTDLKPDLHQQYIDLNGAFLLPGLWDVHCHLGVYYPDPKAVSLFETEAERALRAHRHAQDALHAGVLGARVAGEASYIDVALRDAYAKNTLIGPRLWVSGPPLKVTGGHGADRRRSPAYLSAAVDPPFPSTDPWGGMETDGADGFRRAARLNIKMGVDWIKLFITGGVAGGREGMQELQMTREEVAAAVEVAHAKGLKVLAHIGGPDALRMAVGCGVDSVEHGYKLDEETVTLMAENDVWYVPTLGVTHNEDYMRRMGWGNLAVEKALAAAPGHRETFRMAMQAGVRIANGSDLHPLAETTIGEIEHMVDCGMPEWDAIVAATKNPAELCGVGTDLGTIEPGKVADLIVIPNNPIDDIQNLRSVRMVILEGKLITAQGHDQ